MENERNSLSETSTDRSISSDRFVNDFENINENSEDYERDQKDLNNLSLSLDLKNIENIENGDILEDTMSEKLSAVLEQPEDSIPINPTYEASNDSEHEESNCALWERINSLNGLMIYLRDELKKEVALWKKEREEFQLLREQSDIFALEEVTAAARAAAAAYAAESPLSKDIDYIIDMSSEQALTELTILEYEKKLAKYQDALALAQAERRYNMHRRMVAKAYERRLTEIEQLCNEELIKIQQNANNLQPLKKMMSEWCTENKKHGDAPQEYNFNIGEGKDDKICIIKEYSNFPSVNGEVNMMPEILVSRFQSDKL